MNMSCHPCAEATPAAGSGTQLTAEATAATPHRRRRRTCQQQHASMNRSQLPCRLKSSHRACRGTRWLHGQERRTRPGECRCRCCDYSLARPICVSFLFDALLCRPHRQERRTRPGECRCGHHTTPAPHWGVCIILHLHPN
jgi:hypothetical protein